MRILREEPEEKFLPVISRHLGLSHCEHKPYIFLKFAPLFVTRYLGLRVDLTSSSQWETWLLVRNGLLPKQPVECKANAPSYDEAHHHVVSVPPLLDTSNDASYGWKLC